MTAEHISRRAFLKARELLAIRRPIEEISLETGLSLGAIRDIDADRVQPSRLIVEDDDPMREEVLKSRRCPGCGAMVYHWPCLACQFESRDAANARNRGKNRKQKLARLARKRRAA